MNIILTGYRGTGKSIVSNLLVKELKCAVFSTDDWVEKAEGVSIREIVEEKGWEKFRELEAQAVKEICSKAKNSIIDCGGGVILRDENVAQLKSDGKIVLLTASLDTIMERIQGDENRPPLEDGMTFEEEQKRVLAEREEKYRKAADLICDTTRQSPQEIANYIIGFFKGKRWV